MTDRREAKEARIVKLRPVLHKVFAANPHIKGYSTIKTADKVFAKDRNWRELPADDRQMIFDEYVKELRQSEEVCCYSSRHEISP